jgi:hypothetical protein
MRLSDEVVHEIDERQAATLGEARFQQRLRAVVESLTRPAREEPR